MHHLLPLSMGLGLAVSLVCSELFGLAAGGLIVPGYLALSVRQPLPIAVTLAMALGTYLVVGALAHVLMIYGRRRTALMILVGFLLGAAGQRLSLEGLGGMEGDTLAGVGYVLPGLVAIWFDRQGVVETLCAVVSTTVLTRLLLIVCVGDALLP